MSQPGPPDWRPPETFEEYRLLHAIGRGGMGQVYLGHDVLLDRPVAIKFIAAGEPSDAARQRFLIEARAIARLQHPNVVCVYRAGEVAGRPFIVSEYVRGRSLSRTPKPVSWRRALKIGIGLARGLAAAHRQGVLHRDIKPSNAMLTEHGDVKLLDFGVAKLMSLLPHPEPPAGAARPQRQQRSAPDEPSDGVPRARALTLSGAVLGTPLYMAPEVQAGEPATRQSDVYSLGVVLYELCSGRVPQQGSGTSAVTPEARTEAAAAALSEQPPPPPVHELVEGIDPRLSAIIQRCIERDPARRFDSGEELRDGLEQLSPEPAAAVPDGNPYRGLLAFEAEHRALFFGRGPEIRAIIERLRTEPMVLIAGDSGVGKSSLCRAGVLPLVADGALEDGRLVVVASMVPGKRPLLGLAAALSPLLGEDEKQLAQRLASQPSLPSKRLAAQVPGQPGAVLLFIDQLEELLTLSDPREAEIFDQALGDLLRHPAARVLCTARADFLTRLAMLPNLGREMVRALYLLRPLSKEGTREAIVGPARRKDVRFESEAMLDELVESAQAPGALPLLQFALAELWEVRQKDQGLIPASSLPAIGGVAGALAAHADGVLMAVPPAQQLEARRILTRLVTPGGTRARRTEAEFGSPTPSRHAALEALIKGRLVVARTVEGGTFYEVAHEALLTGWGTLRGWLERDADRRAAEHRIAAAAIEWERLGHAREALWSDRQLGEATAVDPADLDGRDRAFLAASRRLVRRRRRLRWMLGVGLPLVVLLGYLGLRFKARQDLSREIAVYTDQAQAALQGARKQTAQGIALRRQSFHDFAAAAARTTAGSPGEQPRWQEAERRFAEALEWDRAAEESYLRASQQLEAALSRDFHRAGVRAQLGDVTYERVLLSERLGRGAHRDELLARLENFDDGTRRRLLAAPAALLLTLPGAGAPPGAQVKIERYLSSGGRRALQLVRELTVGEAMEVPLPAGSYLVRLSAPGRVQVRLPLLLQRGERRQLPLELPATDAVAPGYVYVPPGRFLFGSADEETLRKGFLNAPPLHEVDTPGYLVGRHEVTFAEWLVFLRSLPPAERQLRTPRTGQIHGGLLLKDSGDGFELTLQPTGQLHRAREGEPIRYGARHRRAVQDWLRFPVSAVSFEDAQAYAAWLARSGRLVGARLCTEHEWERAARGADDRIFPHGDRLAPDDANHDETYAREPLGFGPDEVGSHPDSESPYGTMDMVGNVWEWTLSVRKPGESVVRGGSWYHGELTCRSTNREVGESSMRNILVGLRICAPFPAPGPARL